MPRYNHDCTHCVFLGEMSRYDLYVCPHNKRIKTLVARYGNDWSDYFSGTEFAALCKKGRFLSEHSFILYEALIKAEERGYRL